MNLDQKIKMLEITAYCVANNIYPKSERMKQTFEDLSGLLFVKKVPDNKAGDNNRPPAQERADWNPFDYL